MTIHKYKLCDPKNHRDLGFTDEEFLAIVEFFQELMRLDNKGKDRDEERLRLTAVLRTRTRQLIEKRKLELRSELESLEFFA